MNISKKWLRRIFQEIEFAEMERGLNHPGLLI